MDQAACKGEDTNLFFPERNDLDTRRDAIMICFQCPVRAECDAYRNRTGSTYGIWAGKNAKRD